VVWHVRAAEVWNEAQVVKVWNEVPCPGDEEVIPLLHDLLVVPVFVVDLPLVREVFKQRTAIKIKANKKSGSKRRRDHACVCKKRALLAAFLLYICGCVVLIKSSILFSSS